MNIAAELVYAGDLDPRYIWIDRADIRSAAVSDEAQRPE
jgi:hypothetical protein